MKLKHILGGLLMCGFAAQASAAEFKAASVRALGMGGSNIASTNGVDASYWNPAAYGFFAEDGSGADVKSVDNNRMADKDWGVDLNVDAGIYVFGPIAANLNAAEALPTSVLSLTPTTQFNSKQIVDAAALVNGLASLDSSPQGVNFLGGVSLGARVGSYGISYRTTGDFNNSIAIDNTNVGLDLFTAFGGGVSVPTIPALAVNYFNNTQIGQLQAALVSSGLTAGEANAVIIGYDAALSADPSASGNQADMIAALITMADAITAGNLTNNNTTLSTRGVAISEVGFTYGHAIDHNFSIGGVVKYLQADIIALDVNVLGQGIDSTTFNTGVVETSTGVGLDLGLMYRLPSWQFGLTAKNVNGPSFEHSSGYVYEMKPQAKAGVAWIPMDTLTVEVGFDLTENQGAVADSLSQYWNVGVEWDVFHVVALRVGAFQNIAQSDIGLVPTVGLGFNLWALRVDMAAAISTNSVNIGGDSVPVYGMGSLALAADF